jgi:hypothetical protein
MTTHAVVCACGRRVFVAASRPPEHPTCSRRCRDDRNARLARRRHIVATSYHPTPIAAPPPETHRVQAALTETRATVASLLAEGRRARLTTSGDSL